MDKIKEILNRKPSRWKNLTIKEFERDIELLQEICRHLVIRNEYVEELERKLEQYEVALNRIVEMDSPFFFRETESETPYNVARVVLESNK